VELSDDVLHFFTFLPVLVPQQKRTAIAELCHRLSWGLVLGKFELNFNDGTVRFLTSTIYPKGELPRELLQRIIMLNLSTMDLRLPAFMGVLYADRSPNEAAQLIPQPPKLEAGKQMQLKKAVERNASVITHDSLPLLNADDAQLVELFQRLLDNAIRFRAKAPPRVHVGVQPRQQDWLFSVQDNGIGIHAQHFERIFTPFCKPADEPGENFKGVGLAVCKRIVERHGGRIWVESQPGAGSSFYFTIPHIFLPVVQPVN